MPVHAPFTRANLTTAERLMVAHRQEPENRNYGSREDQGSDGGRACRAHARRRYAGGRGAGRGSSWGYRGGFQRGAFHGGPGFYRPYYRPAFYGGYYRRPYYRPYGGAVAAGLVGGLALGALAASSTYATPYYASPYYVASPGYDYGPACTITRTRFVDGWGRVVIRKTKVCD